MGEFNETGNSDFGIRIDADDQSYLNLRPAIDIATEIETDNGVLLRPKLTSALPSPSALRRRR